MARRMSRAKKRTKRFVDVLIVLCLLMCAIITGMVLYEYHRLDTVLGSGEITALLAVWGGELLLIVIRQVLGSDAMQKHKNEEEIDR
jgi:membrane protein YdbS with pleckstrin-like domain